MTPDGTLLISCRHMNEITKIDRQSGQILWRMGLNALNNMFKFPNDTRGWSHQHDARILPNGHLTLFDNGNNLSPQYSRALEFALDEQNLVATKVWDRHHEPEAYSSFMGNVELEPAHHADVPAHRGRELRRHAGQRLAARDAGAGETTLVQAVYRP